VSSLTASLPTAWTPVHEEIRKLPEKLQQLLIEAHAAGMLVCRQRGYAQTPTEVAMFAPLTAIARSLGIKHNTISTWFRRYQSLLRLLLHYVRYTNEILDLRDGKTKRWHAGSIWVVRLGVPGKIRVSEELFAHPWRDLQADIDAGRTVRQSTQDPTSTRTTFQHWTPVNPVQNQTPSSTDCRSDLFDHDPLLEVRSAYDAKSVDRAARAIAGAVGDFSLNCWRKTVWNAYRTKKLPDLADLVSRIMTDRHEWRALKKPGALLVKRCKEAGLLRT
jgi:hypothetical protein